MGDSIIIKIKATAELTSLELLQIMEERVKVFVVEQNCPYQEVDEKDQTAKHVMLMQDGQLVAYTRIVKHDDPQYISFGRVLVPKSYRGKGFARRVVELTIKEIQSMDLNQTIKIAAQTYLQDFYQSFGFKAVSDPYLEDNIPHIDMILENDELN